MVAIWVFIFRQIWSSININAPNNACTRLGVGPAFLGIFLASAESRFEGESTLLPQAGNASRWVAVMEEKELFT